jgi:hypothetical protein
MGPHRGQNRPPGHIPERLLARLWQQRAARQEGFRTSGGQRLRVIYPGRPSHTAGPDFRNALLEVEGVGLVQGDVEIHVRQQDWDRHGHRDDPNYNGVVLHAGLALGPTSTDLHSGLQVPALSLAPLLETLDGPTTSSSWGLWRFLNQRGFSQPKTADEMAALLDRAGDARFLARSYCIQVFLAEQAPEQTLYEGILEALGYYQNQHSFLQLAGRAPYWALERAALVLAVEERPAAIESWLLKLSGLHSEEPNSPGPLPHVGFGRPMSGSEWRCFRLRPANHPRRRITGAGWLLARFLEPGLVAGLHSMADTRSPQKLAAALTVAASPGEGPAYIGLSRARDIAVNVLLPFFHALAVSCGEIAGSQTYLDLYRCFGRLQDNELTREMTGQLMPPHWRSIVKTARRQQGLLHLQRLLAGASPGVPADIDQ